jgi:hypothetical protein
MKTKIQKLNWKLTVLGAFAALSWVSTPVRAANSGDKPDASEMSRKSAVSASQVVEGVIIKVKESKNEIYVRSNTGKRIEIYLDKMVSIRKSGEEVKFSELRKETKVRVTGTTLVEIL